MKKLLLSSLNMKRALLCFIVVLSSSLVAFSQGIWSSRETLPDSARGEGFSFSIGNYGYIGLGENYNKHPWVFFDDVWQFNPSDNNWTRKGNFPGKARVWPSFFVIGNYAYVVCGRDSDIRNYLTECWQYNSITDRWTQKASFPGLARAYGVGFSIGGKGYIGLGQSPVSGLLKDFWCYDTGTNTWSQIADFGGTRRWCASAFGVNGLGYVCYGQDTIVSYNLNRDMWEYNPVGNLWTQKTSNPGDSLYGTNGFAIGNNIYVGTGQDNSGALHNSFWKYSTITDRWTQESNFAYKAGYPFSFSILDTGYMGLGWDTVTFVGVTNTFYRFVPDMSDGIKEETIDNNITISPNPFNEYCTISLHNFSINEYSEITIYNIEGEKVNTSMKLNNGKVLLNRNGLEQGIYFISIHKADIFYYAKLVITD
jgi:N-acetylneuraminic acid mutarotase